MKWRIDHDVCSTMENGICWFEWGKWKIENEDRKWNIEYGEWCVQYGGWKWIMWYRIRTMEYREYAKEILGMAYEECYKSVENVVGMWKMENAVWIMFNR